MEEAIPRGGTPLNPKHLCEKWSLVKDGFQYCLDCGKAIPAPMREPDQCDHFWKEIDQVTWTNSGNKLARIYVMRCTKCGETAREIIRFDDYQKRK